MGLHIYGCGTGRPIHAPIGGCWDPILAATALLAAAVALFKGVGTFRMTWAQFRGASLLGVVILGVGIGMVSLAERYVPSSIAALVVSVVPLWIIIFRVHAGDRPSRLTLTGVGVGLVGLALMLLRAVLRLLATQTQPRLPCGHLE